MKNHKSRQMIAATTPINPYISSFFKVLRLTASPFSYEA